MTTFHGLLLMFLFTVINLPLVNASEKKVLITANAFKSELVHRNSKVDSNGNFIWAADTYKFSFNNIKLRQGDSYTFPTELSFNLKARQEELILKAESIYLSLTIENKEINVEDWGIVASFVCIQENKIDPRYKDSYFYLTKESEKLGEKCSYLKFYHDTPEE